MTDWLLITISAAVSLAVDLAVDCSLLMKHGIGSEAYRNALKFARKNKSVVNQQDVVENMERKISQLENQMNMLSKNSSSSLDSRDIFELKQEIASIKTSINQTNTNSVASTQELASKCNELAVRITRLEANQLHGEAVVNKAPDMSAYEAKISQLNAEMDTLKDVIRKLNSEVAYLKDTVVSQQRTIQTIPKEGTVNHAAPVSAPTTPTRFSVQLKPVTITSSKVIIPDKAYVKKLLSNLLTVKNSLGKWEYDCCQKGLQEILDNGDFDDGEEIMCAIHELIKKYIYGSDTKVSAEDWQNLEKYIDNAGYVAVPVKAGDSVSPYKLYFDRPIPAAGGVAGTIKQIQQRPFTLTYEDCGEKDTLKLCGKCTYFK